MDKDKQVFLSLKEKITLKNSKSILLRDLADISAKKEMKRYLENLVYPIDAEKESNILIPAVSIISFIKDNVHDIDLTIIGDTDVLVSFIDKRDGSDKYKIVRVILVCFLLFIGSITAIINFHSDVDIRQAHKDIYRIVTGVETDRLLLIQIPYSLGIGVGMAVFFNHVFNKKISKEPTPLEMETYTYQKAVDDYIKSSSVKNRGQLKG